MRQAKQYKPKPTSPPKPRPEIDPQILEQPQRKFILPAKTREQLRQIFVESLTNCVESGGIFTDNFASVYSSSPVPSLQHTISLGIAQQNLKIGERKSVKLSEDGPWTFHTHPILYSSDTPVNYANLIGNEDLIGIVEDDSRNCGITANQTAKGVFDTLLCPMGIFIYGAGPNILRKWLETEPDHAEQRMSRKCGFETSNTKFRRYIGDEAWSRAGIGEWARIKTCFQFIGYSKWFSEDWIHESYVLKTTVGNESSCDDETEDDFRENTHYYWSGKRKLQRRPTSRTLKQQKRRMTLNETKNSIQTTTTTTTKTTTTAANEKLEQIPIIPQPISNRVEEKEAKEATKTQKVRSAPPRIERERIRYLNSSNFEVIPLETAEQRSWCGFQEQLDWFTSEAFLQVKMNKEEKLLPAYITMLEELGYHVLFFNWGPINEQIMFEWPPTISMKRYYLIARKRNQKKQEDSS